VIGEDNTCMAGKYSMKSDLKTIKFDYVKGTRFKSNLKSITVRFEYILGYIYIHFFLM
jgi:hypothetical protein